jgi:hypothetical protein
MIGPDASSPKKPRGGMASLAADLTSRAGSLAHRSTDERLTPSVSTPEPAATLNPVQAPPTISSDVARRPKPAARQSPHQPSDEISGPLRPRPAGGPVRPLAGPEGRLEASGETVVKWTLELAPQLIMALNVWERDETKRLGQRVFRERMIDLALDSLPGGVDSIVEMVGDLPPALRHAPGQQFGTRVRASVRDKLLGLRPELRVAGIKNVRIRDVYSAGVYRYLVGLGIAVEDSSAVSKS